MDLDQVIRLCWRRRVNGNAQFRGSPPQNAGIANRIGRRQHEQVLRLPGEYLDPTVVARFNSAGQRQSAWNRKAASQGGGRLPTRELEQGKRIAMGLGDDAAAH